MIISLADQDGKFWSVRREGGVQEGHRGREPTEHEILMIISLADQDGK